MKNKIILLMLPVTILALSACAGGGKSSTGGEVNFDKVSEYELTETSTEELEGKLKEVAFATASAADNINAEIQMKDFALNIVAEQRTYEDGELQSSKETAKIDFKDINFDVEAGMHGIYSATKAEDLYGYVEMKSISGSMYIKSTERHASGEVDSEGNEIYNNVVREDTANLDNSTFEYYHVNGNEYVHFSKSLKNNFTDILKVLTGSEDTGKMITAMLPSNGKIMFTNDEEQEYPVATAPTEADYENFGEDSIFSSLLETKEEVEAAGYKLSDICSVKVVEDDKHFLAFNIEVTEKHVEKALEIADIIEDQQDEEAIVSANLETFKSARLTVETNADKEVTYAELKIEDLQILGSFGTPSPAGESTNSAISLNKLNFDLRAKLNYDGDVKARIPNSAELENYDDITEKIKAFTEPQLGE